MARPKIYDSQRLVELTEDYFVNTANGDPSMLKFSQLAKFFNDNGIKAEAYNLRRDKALIEKIRELKETGETQPESITDASYKNLDVEGLIRKSYDIGVLRKALMELDKYWKTVYEKAKAVFSENKKLLHDRSVLIRQNKEIAEKNTALDKTVSEQNAEIKQLRAENNYLRAQIKKYVYPAAANVMLGQMNLPQKKEPGVVDQKAVAELIDEGKPKAFHGVQKQKVRKLSREEELLTKMKGMVET